MGYHFEPEMLNSVRIIFMSSIIIISFCFGQALLVRFWRRRRGYNILLKHAASLKKFKDNFSGSTSIEDWCTRVVWRFGSWEYKSGPIKRQYIFDGMPTCLREDVSVWEALFYGGIVLSKNWEVGTNGNSNKCLFNHQASQRTIAVGYIQKWEERDCKIRKQEIWHDWGNMECRYISWPQGRE